MQKRLASVLSVFGVTACFWSCGNAGNKTVATGGSGGGTDQVSGGSTPAGGSNTGGSSQTDGGAPGGMAGQSTGGAAGSPGTGGAGGVAGKGGAGGAGGATASPLAVACTTICGVAMGLSCVSNNPSWCFPDCANYTAVPPSTDQQYLDMLTCIAQNLTAASDYNCSTFGSKDQWAPKAGTTCETLICNWTCADATFGDANVYTRCGC